LKGLKRGNLPYFKESLLGGQRKSTGRGGRQADFPLGGDEAGQGLHKRKGYFSPVMSVATLRGRKSGGGTFCEGSEEKGGKDGLQKSEGS